MTDVRSGSREGRVAIVTGGSRGIGRETLYRLASLGYAVVVNYVHDQRAAEATVDAVLAADGTAVAVRADVADDLDVERLFAQTIETFGAVDAVVHAVRGEVSATSLIEIPLAEFDALYRANLRATFIVNQAAARHVRPGGAIVNVSSSIPASAVPSYAAHAAVAAAVDVLIEMLALELHARDVTVNGVSLEAGECAPDRVANVIAYLLSDDGQCVSGNVVRTTYP